MEAKPLASIVQYIMLASSAVDRGFVPLQRGETPKTIQFVFAASPPSTRVFKE